MDFQTPNEIEHIAELVKNRLYFASTHSQKMENIRNTYENFFFNVDEEFVYQNYYHDFGPLNISCLYKYCLKLYSYLQCPHIQRVVHYTTKHPCRRANGAFLIGCFCMLFFDMEAKVVYRKLLDAGGTYRPFLDASQGFSRYTLKLLDVLQGVERAHSLNFYDFNDFNVTEYDLYDKIQNGDFNWLVPGKFMAFIGPMDKDISQTGHSPNFYIRYFLKNDVRTVVRLNNKLYNPNVFEKAGIEHFDLFFPDGSTPPKQVLLKFLEITENAPGAIAVHCKAGLGRTGSLIGAYIVKHYKFSAREAIAWMRVCRPGSVIGQQQGWLEKIEPWPLNCNRLQSIGSDNVQRHKYGIYSKEYQIHRKKLLLLNHKRTQSEVPLSSVSSNGQQTYKEHLYNTEHGSLDRTFKRQKSRDGESKATQGDKLNSIKMQRDKSKVRPYYRRW